MAKTTFHLRESSKGDFVGVRADRIESASPLALVAHFRSIRRTMQGLGYRPELDEESADVFALAHSEAWFRVTDHSDSVGLYAAFPGGVREIEQG